MTPQKAKQIVKKELEKRRLTFTKLTARTIGFGDLARDNCVFVKIHGWKPNPLWDEIQSIAKFNGFRIE